ncbi:legume-like lectin family domain-containing protein [Ditylenchus destructor]|uniref:Legume-like lectin family domain-containing protein n=1 Tax=Ditylenchus destructor TaxID=166010 RepID=A0AAD4RC36_9BILA|nr:legume-like lectin family domain-containing protein [Ditylenchus destructor]
MGGRRSVLYLLFFTSFTFSATGEDSFLSTIDGSSVNEFRGYYKREHSLIRPYQGAGMEVPYFDIIGSTIVSQQQIRLTADIQSLKGAIWNKVPNAARDWELQVNFRVHGSTGSLFGDGLAIWYVHEPNQLGEVFGSKDTFRGLGIFLDTYSNHNGPHAHSHPYITAMVNNGTLHFDHDSDGTHTALGGEHSGCEAKFRNKDYDTQILVRYVGDTLSIFTDVKGEGIWKSCLSVDGVRLPTNYYFGVSAATGDLSDNHDVISIRMFEQEYTRVERLDEINSDAINPHADNIAAPRDHVDDRRPSNLGWIGTTLLIIIGIVVVVGFLGFGFVFLQKRQERSRKRFY